MEQTPASAPRKRRPHFDKEEKPKQARNGPPRSNMPGVEPRRAALDVLALIEKGLTLTDALADCRSFEALEGPDRAFARALVSTVLRRRGAIDHVIGLFVDQPLPKRAARATDILRLSAAQSLVLRTPDHAAVSTAVALAKEYRETGGYAKLINAVARKIATAGPTALEKLPDRIDTPGWLWRSWERAYGPNGARAIARSHLSEAPIDLTPRDPSKGAAIAEELDGKLLPTGSVRLRPGVSSVSDLPGYAEGRWWVQDAAAALPARLLGPVAGKLVFDLCAAPGGKSMQLASLGARVIAVDVKGERLKLVAENLARVGLSAETIKADVLDWTPPELADAVLLDAPCTATGTIRRHPDLVWKKDEDTLAALTRLQAKMIDRSLRFLKPGGMLIYCTCSLQPEEGERQIEDALSRHKSLRREPMTAEDLPGLAAVNARGDMRTTPGLWSEYGGLDGFFASRLILS